LFAGVGQVIAGIKLSFLTPDMASKNGARHGTDQSVQGKPDAMSVIVF